MTIAEPQIQVGLLQLLSDRGPAKTSGPSAVARALSANDWRSRIPSVRAVGVSLAHAGEIEVRQQGQVVNPETANAPIRYRLIPRRAD
ncbi:MAG: DUF3253 domain-containing protein [Leptolyngbya sp. SIOISBB]|nr:DUF3253 domain-containing protein [Leptolyngbya sp. SIOISBB]